MTSASTPSSQMRLTGVAPGQGWDVSPDLFAPRSEPPFLCPLPRLTAVSPGVTLLSLGGTLLRGRTCRAGSSSGYDNRRRSPPHSLILLPMNQSLALFSLCYQPLSFQFHH